MVNIVEQLNHNVMRSIIILLQVQEIGYPDIM